MKAKIIIIVIMLLLILSLLRINKKEDKLIIENTTTTTIKTTTTTTTKTTTTKKVVKKTKKKVSGFNIKTSKSEMQEYAKQKVIEKWGEEHWTAFNNIVTRESGWNPNLINKKSGACGLFQFVPCSKGGSSYKTDYKVQIQKGINYIASRYGNPKKAWEFWKKHHWY